MDPSTLRSYVESARAARDRAESYRLSYETEAESYDAQAKSYEDSAYTYHGYANDSRTRARGYADEVAKAQRDIDYYTAQALQAEQEAERAIQAARA